MATPRRVHFLGRNVDEGGSSLAKSGPLSRPRTAIKDSGEGSSRLKSSLEVEAETGLLTPSSGRASDESATTSVYGDQEESEDKEDLDGESVGDESISDEGDSREDLNQRWARLKSQFGL